MKSCDLSAQYDIERKAYWMIQDGGGDVVAMCDLQGSGGTARVVRSWQYDAYGQCLRATDVVTSSTIPHNRIGHKGLFMDRLDKSIANPSTYADNKRLEPFSTVLYQNRNRTYSPQLGRFIQRDPNETGQLLAAMQGYMGGTPSGRGGNFGIGSLYSDGGSIYGYLRGSPWDGSDPMGLLDFSLGGLLYNTAIGGTVGAIVGGSIAGVRSYARGDDWNTIKQEINAGAEAGMWSGMVLGAGLYSTAVMASGLMGTGAVLAATSGGALTGTVSGMLNSALYQYRTGDGTMNWNDVANSGWVGMATAGVFAGTSRFLQADEISLINSGILVTVEEFQLNAAVGAAGKAWNQVAQAQKTLLQNNMGSGIRGAALAPQQVPNGLTAESLRLYRAVVQANYARLGEKAAGITNARLPVIDRWLSQLRRK